MDKRTFLITGASKGIGNATANLLGARGHFVLGMARTPPLIPFPGEFLTLDLGDRKQTAEALQDLSGRYHINGVLNNVGLVRPEPLEEVSLENLDAVLDMHLRVALQCTQAALPHMKKNGWGRIVSTSSLTVAGVPFRTSYAAAKTALVSFTRSWALELATTGITVNAVAPGPIETELFNMNNPTGSESRARYINNIPMKRTGTPEEVAELNAFLMSDAAGFITGQTIFIDGGSSIGHALV